ncbi:MAG TPA: hypothetical protein VGC02_00360 [Methanobacterium sp.]
MFIKKNECPVDALNPTTNSALAVTTGELIIPKFRGKLFHKIRYCECL